MLVREEGRLVMNGMKFRCMFCFSSVTYFIFLIVRYQKKVSNIIDDVLEWSPKLALSGMMDKHAEDNATETGSYSHAPTTTEEKTIAAAEGVDADETQDSGVDADETQDRADHADDMRTRSSEA
jgi:translocation protein SEC62